LQDMFDEIYSNNIMVTDIKEIAFHLLEEVGEVSEQIRELRAQSGREEKDLSRIGHAKRELQRELADVLSWMVTLLIKVTYLANNSIPTIKGLVELGQSEEEVGSL